MDDKREPSDLEKVADGIADKINQKVVSIEEGKAKTSKHRRKDKTAAADEESPRHDYGPTRPAKVRVVAGGLPEATDEAERALIQHDAGIYQRSGCLCRISHQQAATVRGITRPRGAVTITPMDRDSILDKLNRLIYWEKWSEKANDYKRCHAPAAVSQTLLSRSGAWKFNPLVTVVSAPTLRPDGSILDQPGYDPTTGLFLDTQSEVFPPIPTDPSREQGQAALRFLNEELFNRPCLNSDRPEDQGFSFTESSDRSAALAAVLTALVRPSLSTAPLFLSKATRPGSAKTLLADIPALVATGRPATVFELGADADEVEKRMLSVLLAGDSVINLDNLEIPLSGATLCKVLSGETITGRLLGFNKTATVPTTALFLATGNNVQVIGDMTRRVVVCNLDPRSEAPESRQYDRNLTTWIPENRPRLVQAGLTALRAYIAAGRPRQPYPPMGSFEDWDLMVRRALTWLGESDPLAGTAQLESADPVRCKLRALLAAWHEVFRTTGATSKEAVTRASETQLDEEGNEVRPAQALWDVLAEYFTDRLGKLKAQLVGEFIRKSERRVEAGMRFENLGTSHDRQVWRVVIVDEQRFQKFHARGKQGDQGDQGDRVTQTPESIPGHPGHPGHPKTPNSENYGGLSMVALLPSRLAQAAGLDLDAMMGGKLSESDWERLSDGAADLQRCLDPDQQHHLAELLARIDAAAQTPAP